MEISNVFRCEICGNMVEVLHVGGGTLVCCGQDMKKLVENTTDAAKEKHVPVIEKAGDGIVVKVGSVAHPMTQEHHIEWIEVTGDFGLARKYLSPGSAPEASFLVKAGGVTARAYCNLHGLWKA